MPCVALPTGHCLRLRQMLSRGLCVEAVCLACHVPRPSLFSASSALFSPSVLWCGGAGRCDCHLQRLPGQLLPVQLKLAVSTHLATSGVPLHSDPGWTLMVLKPW